MKYGSLLSAFIIALCFDSSLFAIRSDKEADTIIFVQRADEREENEKDWALLKGHFFSSVYVSAWFVKAIAFGLTLAECAALFFIRSNLDIPAFMGMEARTIPQDKMIIATGTTVFAAYLLHRLSNYFLRTARLYYCEAFQPEETEKRL